MRHAVQPLRRREVMSEWLLNDDACTVGQVCGTELLYDIGEERRRNRKVVRWMEALTKRRFQPCEGAGILVVAVDILQPRQELVEGMPIVDAVGRVFDTVTSTVAQLLEVPT